MRRPSLFSLSLLTLDFSWPGPTGYLAACCCCCCWQHPTTTTESTHCHCRSWRSRPASRSLPSFLPSFLPSYYNIAGLEVKLAAGWLNLNSPRVPSPVRHSSPERPPHTTELCGLAKPSFCPANYPAAALQKLHFDIQLAGRATTVSQSSCPEL